MLMLNPSECVSPANTADRDPIPLAYNKNITQLSTIEGWLSDEGTLYIVAHKVLSSCIDTGGQSECMAPYRAAHPGTP
ncbi:hypothetical protein E2C01_002003 [Portunus trituberculatus]|uniref:Uncharacterized protein n=1 Tax=Portunus trituberculatus TaxID=210409 RepID=A0A5B7CI81_PORTR|nr:hypothetical protein [Portunus trituberculatus]